MATVLIDKNDKRLKAIKFLTSCMAKNDHRFHIKHFKVESDGSAVSTNGSRLHWVKELPLESGYYKIHKNNKASVLIEKVYDLDTNEGSYPDYIDLLTVPEGEDEKVEDILFSERSERPGACDASGVYTKVVRNMTETTLNFNYVNDIYNTLEGDVVTCIVPEPDKTPKGNIETWKPIHFMRNGYHAVVMPKSC